MAEHHVRVQSSPGAEKRRERAKCESTVTSVHSSIISYFVTCSVVTSGSNISVMQIKNRWKFSVLFFAALL